MAKKTTVVPKVEEPKTHRVTLMPESNLTLPSLFMAVYINGPGWEEKAFAQMFVRADCWKAKTPEEADLVVFVGGEDVNPALYGETAHELTRFSEEDDARDLAMYKRCYEQGIPMLGICRGSQFLHVMNDGKLYQDVDEHNGAHAIWDVRNKIMLQDVSSVHHQMCIENTKGGMSILATSSKARNRWKNPTERVIGTHADIEAYFYRDSCCLGIQGHPEYKGYDEFTRWTIQQIEDLVANNPDIKLDETQKVYRLKPEILASRVTVPQSIIKPAPTSKRSA